MSPRLHKNPLVAHIRDMLRKIGPVVSESGPSITLDNVKFIHSLTSEVNAQIVLGSGGN